MKKKILSFITLLCMLTVLLPMNMATVSAYDGTKYGDYLYYKIEENGEITITECDESAKVVEIPSEIDGKKVTSIGDRAFWLCDKLVSLTISDNVTSIGAKVFDECECLYSITIPNSVAAIGSDAFYRCSNLKKINISNIDAWCNIEFSGARSNPLCNGGMLYINNEPLTNVVISDKVTKLGNYVFVDYSSLKSITIGSGVTSIGNYAFSGCNNLSSVTIPKNVATIGGGAFSGCDSLTNITLPDSVTNIGNSVFSSCSNLKSVTIGSGVTSIGNYAFSDCKNLKNVTIGSGVTSISYGAFSSCNNLTNIIVDSNNENYCSVDGNLFNKSKTELIQYAIGKEDSTYTIPNTVITIGNFAFKNCSNLKNVTIPDSATIIGNNAFYKCNNLSSVTIPKNVTSIGNFAFYYCTSLINITISDNITNIGDFAFDDTGYYNNDSNWENNVLYIGNYLIEAKETITSCKIKEGTKLIADRAFSSHKNLTDITIPNSITNIGEYAFYYCENLTSITIPNSVTSIGTGAFYGCYNLTNVYYNGTEKDWNKISIGSKNDYFKNAKRAYFAYIKISDKDDNIVVDTTQNMGEKVDTSAIIVPDNCVLKLYTNKIMTEEYFVESLVSKNMNLYYDIVGENKLKITGTESADIGQKGITESVTFATDKTAKDFVATIKYSDKLNFVKANSEIFDIEADEYTDDGQKHLSLTCTYKNDGNMPKNTTLNAFDLVFDVSESATANEKLTIEFVNDETFLADGGANTYDFDGLGTAEIKVNPILVKSVTINGADEIDKAMQYTAVISPENATNKDIEWSVDNSEIATISADGILTPEKAGTVKIKATAKGGNDVYAEKSVNVKVYAQITSLTASAGEWDKTFTPSEREYIIYVPKNTSSIKLNPQYNGTLKLGTQTLYNNRKNNVTLTDTETVLTLTYSELGYTDSEYKIKIVKFEGTKTTVSEDGKAFTVKPINIDNGNTIILALYNGDTFVEMQPKLYNGENIPFPTDKVYTKAKVMAWNNLENMTPICDVEDVEIVK